MTLIKKSVKISVISVAIFSFVSYCLRLIANY
jgi:hypothetical protein